ncbi:MAG: aldehyde dehydrogenase family protein, partial [Turneriella sp.]|nr:aldehyde dehydrogenase family protein [Turneriella sp.]
MELVVTNPATGAVIGRIRCDDAASIAAKYQKARAAQPEWQNLPLRERLSALKRFRQLVEQNAEEAALLLTREVGKPITQSRNELKGVLSRLDFFLAETERTLAHEVVFTDNTMREEIEHEPLG